MHILCMTLDLVIYRDQGYSHLNQIIPKTVIPLNLRQKQLDTSSILCQSRVGLKRFSQFAKEKKSDSSKKGK